jgi:hypothetical protein
MFKPGYLREKLLIKPFKGFCKKLSRTKEVKMQEGFLAKMSEFPSLESVDKIKTIVGGVEKGSLLCCV